MGRYGRWGCINSSYRLTYMASFWFGGCYVIFIICRMIWHFMYIKYHNSWKMLDILYTGMCVQPECGVKKYSLCSHYELSDNNAEAALYIWKQYQPSRFLRFRIGQWFFKVNIQLPWAISQRYVIQSTRAFAMMSVSPQVPLDMNTTKWKQNIILLQDIKTYEVI